MTPAESVEIVEIISNHWPGPNWSVASMDAYARAIEPLDCEITMKAVIRAANELEFYPKVAVLREFVRIEKRLAEPDGPIERMLNDTPSAILPPWVKGWAISRYRHGDMRVWAEQPHEPDDVLIPPDARQAYIVEGSELTITQVFSVMGIA